MSFLSRGRTTAYDNISAGNATGRERTINGAAPSSDGPQLGGFGSSTDPAGGTSGVGAKAVSNMSAGSVNNTSDPLNNIVSGSAALRGERLG